MLKIRSMKTWAIIFLTVVYFNFAFNKANASPTCDIKKVSSSDGASRVDLRIGERKVSILGWTHLSPQKVEENKIAQLLSAAVEAARQKECSSAAEKLNELWLFQETHFGPSNQLLVNLKKVDAQIDPNVIAVEYSNEVWKMRNAVIESQAKALALIKKNCFAETKNVAANISILFPGPEYLYINSHKGNIQVQPAEDEGSRKLAVNLVKKLGALPDLAIHELNKQAANLTKIAMQKMKIGKALTTDEIKNVVAAQGQNNLGNRLSEQLNILNQITMINPIRNSKMADLILQGQGNYVFPIGNAHVLDLANQLYQRCLSGEGINNLHSTYGSTIVEKKFLGDR
ncbi:MAG: hypothetical protein ACXVCP_09585 [Bdellovibrio sp.]